MTAPAFPFDACHRQTIAPVPRSIAKTLPRKLTKRRSSVVIDRMGLDGSMAERI
jgi:hypothetical protein